MLKCTVRAVYSDSPVIKTVKFSGYKKLLHLVIRAKDCSKNVGLQISTFLLQRQVSTILKVSNEFTEFSLKCV